MLDLLLHFIIILFLDFKAVLLFGNVFLVYLAATLFE